MNEHLTNKDTWIRGIFILLFVVFILLLLYSPLRLILLAAILVQFGFVLFTGQLNTPLLTVTKILADYLYDVMLYVTFNTDEKPFPFKDLSS